MKPDVVEPNVVLETNGTWGDAPMVLRFDRVSVLLCEIRAVITPTPAPTASPAGATFGR